MSPYKHVHHETRVLCLQVDNRFPEFSAGAKRKEVGWHDGFLIQISSLMSRLSSWMMDEF